MLVGSCRFLSCIVIFVNNSLFTKDTIDSHLPNFEEVSRFKDNNLINET